MADLSANDIYNYAMIMGYTYTGDRTSPPVRFVPSQSFHTSWAFMAFLGTNNMENWLTNNLSLCNMHASSIIDSGMYPGGTRHVQRTAIFCMYRE